VRKGKTEGRRRGEREAHLALFDTHHGSVGRVSKIMSHNKNIHFLNPQLNLKNPKSKLRKEKLIHVLGAVNDGVQVFDTIFIHPFVGRRIENQVGNVLPFFFGHVTVFLFHNAHAFLEHSATAPVNG
jgi:hypothetical protein